MNDEINYSGKINPTKLTDGTEEQKMLDVDYLKIMTSNLSDAFKSLVENLRSEQFWEGAKNTWKTIIVSIHDLLETLIKDAENISDEDYEIYKQVVDELKKFGWEIFFSEHETITKLHSFIVSYKTKQIGREEYENQINETMINYVESVDVKKALNYCNYLFPERVNEVNRAQSHFLDENYKDCILILLKEIEGFKREILGIKSHEAILSKKYNKVVKYSEAFNKYKKGEKDKDIEGLNKENRNNLMRYIIYNYQTIDISLTENTETIDKSYQEEKIHSKFNRHAISHGIDTTFGSRKDACICLSHIINASYSILYLHALKSRPC